MANNEITVANQEIESNKRFFDAITAEGAGQEESQGFGNYYLTDPPERKNFGIFLAWLKHTSLKLENNKVFVGGCGDGLETEVLTQQGYDVTAVDFSVNSIERTRERLEAIGITATLEVANLVELDLEKFKPEFAGVTFAQVAQFIPPVEGDAILKKIIANLTSRTTEGVFYLSDTHYEDPKYTRPWELHGEVAGQTTYHGRPIDTYIGMLGANGMTIVHKDYYNSADDPTNEYDDYRNFYIVATRGEKGEPTL